MPNFILFKIGTKRKVINAENIAYSYPSIVSDNTLFITLYDGSRFRAEEVSEVKIDGVSPFDEIEISNNFR
ncbi:TPA: hypothetical protein PXJ58_003076 [Yersinia enterocolitica]|uniref:hypothetical protein n=1 Tax=Yersinia TaxID=629 RepID=UPI00065A8D30|nr:hypothetical protein [Yersinia enterocolitica]CRY22307.1 Uncharacterised protein [Yersinia enterocolitica]HDL6739086.1 hypothetical protein [Yersinia enterocolitica]HDM8421679.1 hypothetical protein [Yersinia enterocolitica]